MLYICADIFLITKICRFVNAESKDLSVYIYKQCFHSIVYPPVVWHLLHNVKQPYY